MNNLCPKCFSYHPASVGLAVKKPDPSVVLTEHKGVEPSYMVSANIRNTISNCYEIMDLLNENDQLPAWLQEMVSLMKAASTKTLHYIRSQKSR